MRQQGLELHFVKLPTYANFVSLVIEIHINNIDTFRVTNKQYYKIILFYKFLSNKRDFQRITADLFPGKLCQTIVSLSGVNLL